MHKSLILSVIALVFSVKSFSQKGYIVKDTHMMAGMDIVDGGSILNSRTCQVITEDTLTNYSPYEIDEYGINEGKIYVSRNILINNISKRVFLKVLVRGKTNLYYYQDEQYRTFFIGKDSVDIIEIPEKSGCEKRYFRSVLRDLTSDSPAVLDASYLIQYNKKSITEFINRYNSGENKPFPFFKFGVTSGFELSKLTNPHNVSPAYLENFQYNYDGFVCVGLFADLPLIPSNFSFHLELYHASHKFSETVSNEKTDYDLVTNQNSLKMPVLLRYYFYSGRINPYVNAGGLVAYNYHRKKNLYVTTIENDIIDIYVEEDAAVIPGFQYGYSAGAGMEWKINRKNGLFFELRHNKLYGSRNNLMGNNDIQFITGINF